PAVTIVEREGVAGEDALEPRIAVELLGGGATVAGSRSAAAVLGGGGQRGLQIAVVLVGPVLRPHLRINRLLGDLGHPHEGLASFLLALEDVREQGEQQHGEPRHAQKAQRDHQPPAPWPAPAWQWRQSSTGPAGVAATAWTKSAWQRRQFTRTIWRSFGVISMGSLKFWRVKAME